MDFEVGRIYHRQTDIHKVYGGQWRGGIATPKGPYVFLFTGESGEQFGYHDGPDTSGVYLYTGEGQKGDMAFVRGNRAIRDHAEIGKQLALFKAEGKGKCRFVGLFDCANYEFRQAPDVDGNLRQAIVFHLVPISAPGNFDEAESDEQGAVRLEDLAALRTAACAAGSAPPGAAGKDAKRTYYARSVLVKKYVLARAGGMCECCGSDAPFKRRDGTPYLEPHHIRRVSDGGPDHPGFMAGICPTCHRRIHHGADGLKLNTELQVQISRREEAIASGAASLLAYSSDHDRPR